MLPRFCKFLIVISVWFCLPAETLACSIFVLEGTEFATVGRNYDWDTGNGILIVNKRGMSKTALGLNSPMKWDSEYGSVTFNQYGRGFPCGGMNEKGLVIGVAWLDNARYPQPDQRPMISTLQWVQYQLDTAATVEDVVASDKRLRIATISGSRVHYFVAERNGSAATVEFLDGKMVVHQEGELPVRALTNVTYERSLQYYHNVKEKLEKPVRQGSSLSRFVDAGTMAAAFPTSDKRPDSIDYCFEVLRRIAQGSYTKWNIVYDTQNYRIHFKTRKAKRRRFVDLDDLDFGNETPVLTLDLNEDVAGDVVSALGPYSHEQNRAVLTQSLSETPVISALPSFLLDNVAKYPETITPVADRGAQASETLPAVAR